MASIAAGTCSKFGRPPAYKPKTVYIYLIKKKENSNARKLIKMSRAPGKNRTHDPPCSSSDALTSSVIHVMRTLDPVPLVSM